MTVLIDTWAWVEYFKGSDAGRGVASLIDNDEEIIVSSINLAELYYLTLKKLGKLAADKQKESILKRCRVVNPTPEIVTKAAEIKLERKWGLADAIILATAELEHAVLVTGDPHFKDISNVKYLGK